MPDLYKTDYYQWLDQQKQLLASRQFDRLDLDNLLEEVDDMGRSEPRAMQSHLTTLLLHLLKYQYQTQVINPVLPEPYDCREWLGSIGRSRDDLEQLLFHIPHLKTRKDELLAAAYKSAKKLAIQEMNRYVQKHQQLDETSFPRTCPWSFEQVMEEDWLPNQSF